MPDFLTAMKKDLKNSIGVFKFKGVQLANTAEGRKVLFDINIISYAPASWDTDKKLTEVKKMRKFEKMDTFCCMKGVNSANQINL